MHLRDKERCLVPPGQSGKNLKLDSRPTYRGIPCPLLKPSGDKGRGRRWLIRGMEKAQLQEHFPIEANPTP